MTLRTPTKLKIPSAAIKYIIITSAIAFSFKMAHAEEKKITYDEFQKRKRKVDDQIDQQRRSISLLFRQIRSDYQSNEDDLFNLTNMYNRPPDKRIYPSDDVLPDEEDLSIIDPFSFSSPVLEEKIKYSLEGSFSAKDKTIFLVLGRIGAAKSTLTSFLIGDELKRNKIGQIERIKSKTGKSPEIGHSLGAKTDRPDVYSDGDMHFCDSPGIDDNQGDEQRIANTIGMLDVLSQSQNVKGCVILIPFTDFIKGAGDIGKTAKKITSVFKDVNNSFENCVFLITRIPPEYESENREMLLSQLSASLLEAENLLLKNRTSFSTKTDDSIDVDKNAEYMLIHLRKHIKDVILVNDYTNVTLLTIKDKLRKLKTINKKYFRFLNFEKTLSEFINQFLDDINTSERIIERYESYLNKEREFSSSVVELKKEISAIDTLLNSEKKSIDSALAAIKDKLQTTKTKIDGYSRKQVKIFDDIEKINSDEKRIFYVDKELCVDGFYRTFHQALSTAGYWGGYSSDEFLVTKPQGGFPFELIDIKMGGELLPEGRINNKNGRISIRDRDRFGIVGSYKSNSSQNGDLDITYYCKRCDHPASIAELDAQSESLELLSRDLSSLNEDKELMEEIKRLRNKITTYQENFYLRESKQQRIAKIDQLKKELRSRMTVLSENIEKIALSKGFEFIYRFSACMQLQDIQDESIQLLSTRILQLKSRISLFKIGQPIAVGNSNIGRSLASITKCTYSFTNQLSEMKKPADNLTHQTTVLRDFAWNREIK